MEVILIALALYGAYILWTGISRGGISALQIPFVTSRGLLAVKAAWYLMSLEANITEDDANIAVKDMNIDMPTEQILMAERYMKYHYNGHATSLIAEARQKGFLG